MEELPKHVKPTDFLANERTYLAWVRTSIGIMAFGFVVVKFSLFVRQISLVLGNEVKMPTPAPGYSQSIGVLLVGLGVICLTLSYLQFRKTDRQLRRGIYMPTNLLTNLLTGLITLISILLIIYLARSV
ncbi:YidH family protein [Dyadobacter tibetensis]|uniref:YidH family protein n=1 Tax=Dyadobacter tibetensis TaxID=1211851 RepID=UPI000471ABDD|nr:DUF202 domain-containing protein [Dyadobacter tibetensis]